MIQIEDLTIGYHYKKHERVVAAHIHADIRAGELTCLLGENGVGKSTLMRTLAAFQPKLGGAVWIDGQELSAYTDRQLARRISVVLTEKCDIRNMLASELIGLGRSPYTGFWGTLTAEDRLKVEEAASLVGITPLLRRMVHTLSDGERQKVMIAKALAQETPVIFLDEPTAFLDFPSKIEMMQLLWRLSRQTHKTIFLSTHDLDLALQIADRVWLMDREQGITVGTPEDLTLDGRLARFFQRKGMAFNAANGLYEVAYQFRTSIRLMGAEQPVRMVAKALRRNGVASGSTIASERWIEATAEGFQLHEPDGTVCHFSTIDQLLQALRPLFQQIASDIE